MCYSAESSINNYGLGVALSTGLFLLGNKYDKHFAFFLFFVIQIQLLEYFMWKDQKCGIVNKIATVAANALLFLQPLAVIYGGYMFDTLTISKTLLLQISYIYLFLVIIGIIYKYYNAKKICAKAPDGFLVWFGKNSGGILDSSIIGKLTNFTYFFFMFVPWLFMKNIQTGSVCFLLVFGSFVIHFIYHNKGFEWQTKWCFYTIISLVLFILYKITTIVMENA